MQRALVLGTWLALMMCIAACAAEEHDPRSPGSPAWSPGEGQDTVHLYEFGIHTGYGWGKLKKDQGQFEVFPASLHLGFNINPLLGLETHRGTLQFALEPFANSITVPENGVELGLDFFLRYAYPVLDRFSMYLELGAGPMYFGIDTIEQGEAGFNFLDQLGGGVQYFIWEDKALTLGYRWRHVSHAGLGNGPNTGINAHSIILGVSTLF